ncbi:MATE family efflux transporter [Achromobacter xylosoxidans]|uniref:MATE family efflux transporter n=1 Tax=Alcaligenes xylosoxydans xylosoxydans TaxID=85698 RepID=UPI000332111D|nr:MATE family efflux transporter [Achromobacter xylosoxidans]CCH07229.1 MATE efflux family protein [Achromobacter xylosoxidans NH44784-1996]
MSATSAATPRPANARLQAMLHAPIAPTLARLAWPNILMMLAQSATGLIETWFLARLGTPVLAGVALVVPVLMLMQNMSQGAMGGGISAAVARTLGAGRQREADQLVLHAVVLNAALGIVFCALLLAFGPQLYRALGADGATLDAALAYSNVIFGGIVLMWLMNAFASVIRGTGNMLVPGAVICGGAALLVPLSPCLIFGWGPFPALGVAGGGWALVTYYAAGTLVLGGYCLSGRNAARLTPSRLHLSLMRSILRVGALATLNPLLTNGLVALTVALVGAHAGTAAVAGYGIAVRLEYLMIPLAFGLGAPMVAMVGANIGAGQPERALRIALTGGAMAFALAEVIGLAAALFPEAWLRLFGAQDHMLAAGAAYLRIVGPVYGFFALGFSMYFASQGAGRLKWPLWAGVLRLAIAIGLGGAVLRLTGSLAGFFAVAALAMAVYGLVILAAVASGSWFERGHLRRPGVLSQR